MSFDGRKKRLYVYDGSSGVFTSSYLDGSNSTSGSITNIEFFTVDGFNNVIYYHHESEESIRMYNIANDQKSAVDSLSDISSVKDLDMDDTNG